MDEEPEGPHKRARSQLSAADVAAFVSDTSSTSLLSASQVRGLMVPLVALV
jgi:hypothetical protein